MVVDNGVAGYDRIVVGAGTAGCVLAARLSEDAAVRVLLLEAGPAELGEPVPVPPAWPALIGSHADWGSATVPGAFTARVHPFARGRGLGGSSSINAMTHLRAHRDSYDAWGLTEWGFDALLPYFRATETAPGRPAVQRGQDGPMLVRPPEPLPDLARAVREAARETGLPIATDVSGGTELGIGSPDVNIVDGRRQSAADAYLAPARSRDNLTVVTDALVHRVLFDGRNCVGVEYEHGGTTATAALRPDGGEIVLSAGCVGSPQLLLRSGVGPGAAVSALGVDVVVDAPAVGANLQDHPMTGITWSARRPPSPSAFQHSETLGILASQAGGGVPDLHVLSVDVPWVPPGVTPPEFGYSINVALMAPRSRGTVRLRSPDPLATPEIDPNYLADDLDRAVVVEGLRLARRIGGAAALAPWRDEEFLPGASVVDEQGLLEHVRDTAGPYFHGVGTCAMGTGPGSVLDPRLRVRGVEGLRVADASVMPSCPSGNTNATVLAIAEKAAELLSGSRRVTHPVAHGRG